MLLLLYLLLLDILDTFVELFFSAHPAAEIRPAVTPTINMVIRAVDAVYGLALLNRTNQVPSLDLTFLR